MKGPNIAKCNDTVLNVNIFLKKLCIREQIECVDAYELFTKQGNVLKSLFDNTDSSGVHISVEGCTKIRDKIVTFSDSDKVISAELKTTRKRTNSALLSTPNANKPELYRHKCSYLIKGESLLTIGYTNFSHVTIVFIAKYLFTGSVKILNKMVFIIAIKFISMRIPEISYCLYSEKFK